MFGIAQIDEVIKELDLGLNDERPKLVNLLMSDKPIKRIVVEHKAEDDKEDLNQDFISIITSFYARIYSKRRVTRKTKQFMEELTNESNRNS